MPRTRAKKSGKKRISKPFRINGVQLNYVKVLKPELSYGGDGLEFSAFLIFDDDHPQAEALDILIEDIADEAQLSDNYVSPIRTYPECKQLDEGQIGLNAKSQFREERPRQGKPILVDSRRNPINSSDDIYSGCIANVAISLYSYEDKAGGVAVGLQGIQVTERGPRLDGSLSTDEMFDEVADGFVTENSFDAESYDYAVDSESIEEEPKPKRRRAKATEVPDEVDSHPEEDEPAPKKRRGRPKAAANDEATPKRRGRPKVAATEEPKRGRKPAANEDFDLYAEDELI